MPRIHIVGAAAHILYTTHFQKSCLTISTPNHIFHFHPSSPTIFSPTVKLLYSSLLNLVTFIYANIAHICTLTEEIFEKNKFLIDTIPGTNVWCKENLQTDLH